MFLLRWGCFLSYNSTLLFFFKLTSLKNLFLHPPLHLQGQSRRLRVELLTGSKMAGKQATKMPGIGRFEAEAFQCLYRHRVFPMTMLTFPEKTFPTLSRTCPRFDFMLEQTSCARALCEDFRHFLSEPSITGYRLCEDFPIILFGGAPAAGYAEKSFSMQMFGEHVRAKANLVLWHFEGKNQKMRVRRGRLFE